MKRNILLAAKDSSGNMQALVWDFTNTLPDFTNNQQYFICDLPSKSKGKLKANVANVPAGNYTLEVNKIGYCSNDAYSTYLSMGKYQQLTKQQVKQIKKQNDGSRILKEVVRVKEGSIFERSGHS